MRVWLRLNWCLNPRALQVCKLDTEDRGATRCFQPIKRGFRLDWTKKTTQRYVPLQFCFVCEWQYLIYRQRNTKRATRELQCWQKSNPYEMWLPANWVSTQRMESFAQLPERLLNCGTGAWRRALYGEGVLFRTMAETYMPYRPP